MAAGGGLQASGNVGFEALVKGSGGLPVLRSGYVRIKVGRDADARVPEPG